MQGSVQKRKTEIELWETDRPRRRTSRKSGRKSGDVDIIDLYPEREDYSAGRRRAEAPARSVQVMEADRRSREAEPARRSRGTGREVELIGDGAGRTARPIRRSDRADRIAEPIGRSDRTGKTMKAVRRSDGAGERTESVRRSGREVRAAELARRGDREVRRNRTAESGRYRDETVELIGIGRGRAEEPVRRRRAARREEEWDVEIIGQDWAEDSRRQAKPKKRQKAKKSRNYLYRTIAVCSIVLCLLIASMAVDLVYEYTVADTKRRDIPAVKNIVVDEEKKQGIAAPDISEDFLEINDFSRPGTKLPQVNSIFVHYTANPGTSALQNRSYFANLAETQERSASAHFIIGYEGEIVQCMPLDEQAYAVMTRNEDSISIECCYQDADGHFTQETYDSLVHLLAWLEQEYDLGSDDILRHYDCGGKKCPIYYVEHEDAWDKLLADVETYRIEHENESQDNEG